MIVEPLLKGVSGEFSINLNQVKTGILIAIVGKRVGYGALVEGLIKKLGFLKLLAR